MKRLEKFIRIIFYQLVTLLVTYITLMILVPEKINSINNLIKDLWEEKSSDSQTVNT